MMTGKMAKSLYGHDTGSIYVVVGEKDGFVYLANGKERTVERPKKKNKKHIQIIKNVPEDVEELICSGKCDLNIRRAVKLYRKTAPAHINADAGQISTE